MRRGLWVAATLTVMAGVGFAEEAGKLPTVKVLVEQMEAKFAQIRSFEADSRYLKECPGEPKRTRQDGHWAMEIGEEQGKKVLREFNVMKLVADEWIEESKKVNDGKFEWDERRTPRHQGVMVTKSEPDEINILDWLLHIVKEDGELYGLKVVGEEEIDGQKMYVLEGSRTFPLTIDNQASLGMLIRMKMLGGTKDLILRRWVIWTSLGPMVETVEYFNLKVDQKIDPEVFKYTPPEGAKVEDRTKE